MLISTVVQIFCMLQVCSIWFTIFMCYNLDLDFFPPINNNFLLRYSNPRVFKFLEVYQNVTINVNLNVDMFNRDLSYQSVHCC